ncbi:DUF481 domain-containing protein, partial [Robiginitalea sp.]|uniref:DUF481 domain-containing protein n=1 Tax=Robiginitalea sp. TaxID=1902411 RepID=UPI003C4A9BF6
GKPGSADLYYNTLITTQDDVSDIQRNDTGIGFRYFLPRDWNLGADIDFLSNTEQSLDLRTTGKIGLGKFLKRTNSLYWNVTGGVAFTAETYSPVFDPEDGASTTAPSRRSMEGFIVKDLYIPGVHISGSRPKDTSGDSFLLLIGKWR